MRFPRLTWSPRPASQRPAFPTLALTLVIALGACANDLTSPTPAGELLTEGSVALSSGSKGKGRGPIAGINGVGHLRAGQIGLAPQVDTIAPGEAVHFEAFGRNAVGDSVEVRVTLQADGGSVDGMRFIASELGTYVIRAVQRGGNGQDTAWVTVARPAPATPDSLVTTPPDNSPTAPPDTTTATPDTTATPPDTTTAPSVDTTPGEPEPVPAPAPLPSVTGSVAELPRVYLDTRYSAPTGRVISVPAGGSLQAAIDNAARGDVIELPAGATFTGNFLLPPKPGAGWITIRTAGALPAEGTRMMPSAAAGLAKISTPNSMPALYTRTSGSVSYWRIMGVELKSAASMTYAIVDLGDYSRSATSIGDLPNNIVLDRVYIHGDGTQDIQRCLALNSRSTAIVNSWLSACHYRSNESQAIAGWYGPGPFKIVNNHIEGGSENLMFGGADPKFTGLVPSDIEVRGNHFYKPLSWKGAGWAIKNLLELKNAQRLLIEGNLFENNWAEAQTGFAVVLKSQNQEGSCYWCVTQDVTWRYNRIVNSPGGFNILATQTISGGGAVPATRIDIRHTVFDQVGQSAQPGAQRIFQLLGSLTYVTIEHNTALGDTHLVMFDGTSASNTNYVFRNNVFARGEYGIFGSSVGEGLPALTTYAPGAVVERNVLIGASQSLYPAGNFFPASEAAAGLLADYSLSGSSPYRSSSTDGTAAGADIAGLNALLARVK